MSDNININKTNRMKANASKFMRHLADDVVSENHHLKAELIKVRKVLKDYETHMVDQFLKLAGEMGDHQDGFFFDSPQEYLDYFIAVLNRNVHKAYGLERKNKEYEAENRDLERKRRSLEAVVRQLTSKQEQHVSTIATLEARNVTLEGQLKATQTQLGEKKRELEGEVGRLREEKAKMESEYSIKYLEEKKTMMEKANRDIAKLRVDMDAELHQKEKALKLESDRRDREIKSLLNTINSIVENKDRYAESRDRPVYKANLFSSLRLSDLPSRRTEQAQEALKVSHGPNPIALLGQVIKPFTQHSNLLEKLSECRREILQLKNEIRQQNTNVSTLTSAVEQKQAEVELLNTKLGTLQQRADRFREELIVTTEELQKSNQDKEDLEKYYNERWNTEINKVKYNMEKRYTDRETSLEDKYKELMEDTETEREQLRAEKAHIRFEVEKLQSINDGLLKQLMVVKVEKDRIAGLLKVIDRQAKEVESMHNEDMWSMKVRFAHRSKADLNRIQQYSNQVEGLKAEIEGIKHDSLTQLSNLKREMEQLAEDRVRALEMVHAEQLSKKDEALSKLATQIESHKATIQSFQRSESEKMEEIKEKINKQKQKELRDNKVAHLEEVTRLNEKALKAQEKLKALKTQSLHKTLQHENEAREQEEKMAQLNNNIAELQAFLKTNEAERKSLEKEIESLQKTIASNDEKMQSLETEIASYRLIIRTKEAEIASLVEDRKTWLNDIQACRKEFEAGFKELKQINENKLNHCRSRIWELERICEVGGISRKDYERIRSLTQEKKRLEEKIIMQEAENLILNQVKNYYENKSKELDTKMVVAYELKEDKKPILVRRPRRNPDQLKIIRTQISEDLDGFTGKEAVDVKRFLDSTRNKDRSEGKLQTAEDSEYKRNSRCMSRSKARVNSSLM